jgi:hypothetical protein
MGILSAGQKQSFSEHGFLLCREFFPPPAVAGWRDEMARLVCSMPHHPRRDLLACDPAPPDAPADPANPHRGWRIMDLPLLGDTWFQLACDPRIVGVMSDLLGPDVNFHNGKAILKPPHFRSRDWGWHQDWPYERHSEPDLAAAIIYLHDMDAGAGATEVLPGSHRQGEWEHTGGDHKHTIAEDRIGAGAGPVPVQAGDVLFIHVLVVHRAGINASATSRCGVINEYKTAAARDLWGNRLAFAEMPLVRGGRLFCRVGEPAPA